MEEQFNWGKMLEGRNKLIVTGITKPLRTYMYEPKAYMTSNHIPDISHRNSFILVKVKPSYDVRQIAYEIRRITGFLPLTPDQFVERSNQFFVKNTYCYCVYRCRNCWIHYWSRDDVANLY